MCECVHACVSGCRSTSRKGTAGVCGSNGGEQRVPEGLSYRGNEGLGQRRGVAWGSNRSHRPHAHGAKQETSSSSAQKGRILHETFKAARKTWGSLKVRQDVLVFLAETLRVPSTGPPETKA